MWLLGWLGRLPLAFLYKISDVFYVLIYHVVGYRKRLVTRHLKESFPEKTPQEIIKIRKEFYQLLADLFVETLKLPYLSAEEIQERVQIDNFELPKGYIDKGQSFLSFSAHIANWEWVPGALTTRGIPVDVVYKNLTSRQSDEFMVKVRSSFGVYPIPMQRLMREVVARRKIIRTTGLVADQSPHEPEHAHWLPFLHHETGFFPGTEKIARTTKMPVVFGEMYRTGRGYYTVLFHSVAEPPYDDLPEGAITESYKNLLEAAIRRHPSEWLWSHNRWKHKKENFIKS
jgi:Kdo2-lipid IVA lauroyltransferase/acyltransferase